MGEAMKGICLLVLLGACSNSSSSGGDVNQEPVAHDDHLTTPEDQELSLQTAVLANDDNTSPYNSYITVVDKPAHGSIRDDYGDPVYVPEIGYHGPDHLTYKVASSTASVDIDVQSNGIPYERGMLVDGGPAISLVTGDLDGDGIVDLAAIDTETHSVIALLNRSPPGNIDQDGPLELISIGAVAIALVVQLDRSTPGSIAYDQPYTFATARGPMAVQAIDVDHAGGIDVVVLCASDAALSLFSNATALGGQVPAFAARVNRETRAQPGRLQAGDLDGDG